MPSDSHLSAEELAAYIDGRSDPSEWDRMTSHLAACPTCRRELLAVLRLIRGSLGGQDVET
jgi:anti-sigma factor RsiW